MKSKSVFILLIVISCITNSIFADVFGVGGNQFEIDFVTIGDPCNPADSTGYGAVDHEYQIGKYEISNVQWNSFVLLAGKPAGNGSYSNDAYYSGDLQPTNNVSWFEAVQFCNYLTSGDKSKGVYQFSGDNSNPGDFLGIDRDGAKAVYGKIYFLPTEDEWYKAAYYKPSCSLVEYTLYANGQDTAPVAGVESIYYDWPDGTMYSEPWDVGSGAVEQNGTFDMMGNVWEWNETLINFYRGVRGGVFSGNVTGLKSTYRRYYTMPNDHEYDNIGFRVACSGEAKYSGGRGEANDPYQIADANDLNEIGQHSEDWSSYFILVNDINMADYTGSEFNIIGDPYGLSFDGVFDGNGKTISNFSYILPDANYVGLFAIVGEGGEVKQLFMQNMNVSANQNIGGLVGVNSGIISGCGGVFNVQGEDTTGGLVGCNSHGMILNCYSKGIVDGNNVVGGLVGLNFSGTILNSYSTTSVLGDNQFGGLTGDNGGMIIGCFWDVETSGQLVSDGPEVGKSTAEMKKKNTFTDAGWDFVETWGIGENQSYPYLRVYSAGDINHDCKVNFVDFAIFAGQWLEVRE